jgi:hypothetical protein
MQFFMPWDSLSSVIVGMKKNQTILKRNRTILKTIEPIKLVLDRKRYIGDNAMFNVSNKLVDNIIVYIVNNTVFMMPIITFNNL